MAMYIRSRDHQPDKWYKNVEQARDRSKKFKGKLVALHQTNSVVVGKLSGATVDRLWQVKYPYCKISLESAFRFTVNGGNETNLGNDGVFWVNNPNIILSMDDLSKKFPKVYREVLPKIKTGVW